MHTKIRGTSPEGIKKKVGAMNSPEGKKKARLRGTSPEGNEQHRPRGLSTPATIPPLPTTACLCRPSTVPAGPVVWRSRPSHATILLEKLDAYHVARLQSTINSSFLRKIWTIQEALQIFPAQALIEVNDNPLHGVVVAL